MSRIAEAFRRIPRGARTAAVAVLAFCLGLLLGGGGEEPRPAPAAPNAKWYTCSMHPQIRLPDPDALCPICGMELIPVPDAPGGEGTPRTLVLSEAARALAEIETAPVERRAVVKEIRLVGKVDYDETRLRSITAWVPGRLDRLYVDYTGVAVRTGAPLVHLYSPELLVAQEGLLEADRALGKMRDSPTGAAGAEMQQATVTALEQRLRLWGLTEEQVAEIRRRGSASDHMTILSPISGIVIHKRAVEGDYVAVGTKVYEIADLSRVWVYLDAYESDMAWIRYAQEVVFEAEAYPGEEFHGRVSFVDPFLDERTRTVNLRVTVDNADGRLKPGMFVRARIRARLAAGGAIVEPYLEGKWISPVHPEVVRDEPGDCPVCGTPLVSAESLGYAGADPELPLVVPATAPLRTGRRAVVYVEVPGADRPTYEGREIALGTRTESHYLVADGLREGERVVVRGNFKIDSALQILARPSMMSPEVPGEPAGEEGRRAGPAPKEARERISDAVRSYLAVADGLASDDLEAALAAAPGLAEALDAVPATVLGDEERAFWVEEARNARTALGTLRAAADLEAARRPFALLSDALLRVLRRLGHAGPDDLVRVHCPMAFSGRGADWIQVGEEIRNPYFGSAMFRCGDVQGRLPAEAGD